MHSLMLHIMFKPHALQVLLAAFSVITPLGVGRQGGNNSNSNWCSEQLAWSYTSMHMMQEVEREYSQEDAMAQAVVDLIKETACSTCLVWAKSDNFMRLVKELSPEQRCGYVVMPGQPYNGSIKDQAQYKQCSLLRMPEMEVGADSS